MNKNTIFNCHKCGKSFMAASEDYRTVYWHGDILKEAYCPFCGAIIQINTNKFKSSGGGKF